MRGAHRVDGEQTMYPIPAAPFTQQFPAGLHLSRPCGIPFPGKVRLP